MTGRPDEMFHDDAQDGRFHELPVAAIGLGHRHEVAAQEDAGHVGDLEQAARQRRALGAVGIREIGRAGAHHRLARQKLHGRRIGGVFGLDKHAAAFQGCRVGMIRCRP